VRQQFKELQVKASSFESPIHEGLITFLAFVASCLEVNQNNRPPAETLAKQFNELYTRLDIAVASNRGSLSLSQKEETISMSKTAKLESKVD